MLDVNSPEGQNLTDTSAPVRPSGRLSLPELFDRALAHGGHTHTRADILDGLKAGRFQWWGDADCCCVTEIQQFPQNRKLNMFIAAGDLARLFEVYLPTVKAFAREHGCVSVTSTSRPGFLRRYPDDFHPVAVVFESDLTGDGIDPRRIIKMRKFT